MEWFKIYKMPDGKPANEFAFNGEPKDREFAEKIIAGTHESWRYWGYCAVDNNDDNNDA